jgi:hypothetical protein
MAGEISAVGRAEDIFIRLLRTDEDAYSVGGFSADSLLLKLEELRAGASVGPRW